MALQEESFRIGCGRYIQGRGFSARVADEALRVGTSPLIVGGKTALGLTKEKIEKGVSEKCDRYEFIVYTGTCNEEKAREIAAHANENGYDVIVGVGGGVICDFCKLIAHFAALPAINVPTSSATCACYTPFSIRYTPEGKTVGSLHYPNELSAVIADTEVIAAQPPRLLLAGVFDALAKFIEIKQNFNEKTEKFPLGFDYAYFMSKHSYDVLIDKTQKCLDDMAAGVITDDVEKVIFTAIAATGNISGIARGSKQAALAHKFYYVTRSLFPEESRPYLHGEIVGVGLILQNHFNGEEKNNAFLLELMKKYNMPYRLEDIGIEKTEENFNKFYEMVCGSDELEGEEEYKRFEEALKYLWNEEWKSV